MKKALALLCAAALAASLAACGSKTAAPEATPPPAPTAEPTPDVDPDQPATPPEGETGETGESGGAPVVAEPDADLAALVESIYAQHDPGIMVATNAVALDDPNSVLFYLGDTDTAGMQAAVASEAMIGSQAYSLLLVRADADTDAAELADRLAAGVDPIKWVCVGADDMLVGAGGDVAMLVMVDSQLAESVTAQNIADAFVAAVGEGASAWVPETTRLPDAAADTGEGAVLQPLG